MLKRNIKLLTVLVVVSLVVGVSIFYACKKDEKCAESDISVLFMEPTYSIEEVQSVINEINSGAKGKLWEKIKKWFKDHTGTHLFNNCHGGGSCGPCPGICFHLRSVSGQEIGTDIISSIDYQNGYRAFGLSIIQDFEKEKEEVMFVFFDDVNDFTYEGYFYIENDGFSTKEICDALGIKSIKFEKGKYHVVYDPTTNYYYSLVKAVID